MIATNIIVCIKQVPGTAKVNIDEETGVLLRMGVASKMNPYDLYAIEAAIKLKELTGGSITVLTMGPPQAEAVIREAFMLGADKGVLLSDRRFAGADVLATSYALASGIKSMSNFDVIICGKQTTDGDTAQVGPAIAQWLDIPHVAWVSKIIDATCESITVEQDLVDFSMVARMKYKCLITVEKDVYNLRLPSYRAKLLTKDREITVISLDGLEGCEESKCGLKGSPTQVEKIFPPEKNDSRVIYEGEHLGRKIYNILLENKLV